MAKAERYRAFLVTALQRHQPRQTYAIVKQTSEEALAAIKELSTERSRVYLVGGLSRNLVRHMKMKPNDMRLMDSSPNTVVSASGSAELLPSLPATQGGN